MNQIRLLICYIVLFLRFVSSTITDKLVSETWIVDINDEPSVYLNDMCQEYKEAAIEALDKMLEGIVIGSESDVYEASEQYWNDGNVPEPYYSELIYISECLDKDIIDIVTANLIYEFTAYCTSIITVDNNGKIFHGRNQDFPIILRNDTINIKYVDGNEELFIITTFFGFVGAPTCVKKDAFSVSMNARYVDPITWKININSINNGNKFPSSWLVRECLLKDDNYDECLERLETSSIMAPIYYIIAGTDYSFNGAIITRTPDDLYYDTKELGSDGNWYLVETNFDDDIEYSTDSFDERKLTAINQLTLIGQMNINTNTLYNVLSTKPTLAQDTIYTTIMYASFDSYETDYKTIIRYTADLHLSPINGICEKHEDCRGYGLLKTDIACCNNKCQRKQIDYLGIGWCPNQCQHAVWCPYGTCIETQKQSGESCECHEQCKGYGLDTTDMACCDGICRQKQNWWGFGVCPNELM
eukprot:335523_1